MTFACTPPPVTADIAASLAVSDRTEARLRDPGDYPAGPSVDLATVPEAHLLLAAPRVGTTLAYTPRLSLFDVNDVGARPTLLDAGSLRLTWRPDDQVTLTLDEDASYGGMNFAALSFAPGPDGLPPRVDAVPAPRTIWFDSTSTTLGSRVKLRRWEFHTALTYQLSGGADASARTVIPLQRGPQAEAGLAHDVSPVDQFVTTLSGAQASFSSGPEIELAEVDESWKHRFSPVAEMDFTLGGSEANVRPAPVAGSFRETNPVAEAIWEQRLLTADDRFTFRVGARLGPVVNRLLGIVDERVQGTLMSEWTHGRLVARAFGSAQQSVPTGGSNATELFAGELDLAYTASDAMTLDLGLRGLRQKANQPVATGATTSILETDLAQGMVFVGVTFRARPVRF